MNQPPQPETMEAKINKLKARRQALLLNLFEQNIDFNLLATQHIAKIKSKYGDDVKLYKAYHALNSSSVEDWQPHYDFPEPEYSVEEFIQKMEDESSIVTPHTTG